MKCEEFRKAVLPVLRKGDEDGDRWMINYVSSEEDGALLSLNRFDSGDALVLIEILVKKFGIHPQTLATMVGGDAPFFVDLSTPKKDEGLDEEIHP
jgi:hypothetical protein